MINNRLHLFKETGCLLSQTKYNSSAKNPCLRAEIMHLPPLLSLHKAEQRDGRYLLTGYKNPYFTYP